MILFRFLALAALLLAASAQGFAASPTRARLVASPNPSKLGGSVMLRAEVDGLGGGAPTGSVSFADGYTPLGTGALSSLGAGQALLAARRGSTCAVTQAGGLMCWGFNSDGQLGDGTTKPRRVPVAVSGLSSGVVATALGYSHGCALTEAGAVLCWGANVAGQLGDGSIVDRWRPVAATGLASGVVAIAAGGWHSCALTAAGAVLCWGHADHGQVPGAASVRQTTPVAAPELSSGVVAIALGEEHGCALTDAGAVRCWGMNLHGQLGDGTESNERPAPVTAIGLESGVVAIAAGEVHTCALTNAGAVECWGGYEDGQLGYSTRFSSASHTKPTVVTGLSSGVVAIAAGAHHSCALTSAGAVKCWGLSALGELGNGSLESFHDTPVDVVGLESDVVAIAAGSHHSCALTAAGVLKCWGGGPFGQLGDGGTGYRLAPTSVVDFNGLVRSRAALSTSALGLGSHLLRAGFGGDATHSSSIGSAPHRVVP